MTVYYLEVDGKLCTNASKGEGAFATQQGAQALYRRKLKRGEIGSKSVNVKIKEPGQPIRQAFVIQ